MIPIVRQLAELVTDPVTTATRTGVRIETLFNWFKGATAPRLDLFIAVANSKGYDVILRKQKSMRIINSNKRIECFIGGELIAYVENDILFGIKGGYAEEICTISHRVEIPAKLAPWRAKNGQPAAE